MASVHELHFLLFALERGTLRLQHALETSQAWRQKLQEQATFVCEIFWRQKGWLSKEELQSEREAFRAYTAKGKELPIPQLVRKHTWLQPLFHELMQDQQPESPHGTVPPGQKSNAKNSTAPEVPTQAPTMILPRLEGKEQQHQKAASHPAPTEPPALAGQANAKASRRQAQVTLPPEQAAKLRQALRLQDDERQKPTQILQGFNAKREEKEENDAADPLADRHFPMRTVKMQGLLDPQVPEAAEEAEEAWHLRVEPSKRYTQGGVLGRGGIGVVHQVSDHNLGREVARKTLLKGKIASEKELHSFIQEARLTGQLEHPNIVPVYELGAFADALPYYTMRMLPKHHLGLAIQQSSLSLQQLCRVLQQVCMGLEYAHSRGVVHCDIKPSNILLGQFGEVLILDWGTAKPSADAKDSTISWLWQEERDVDSLQGTPSYLDPAYIRYGKVTPSLDQYALGVILYQGLTGSLPFVAQDIQLLLFQICEQEPQPPSRHSKATQDIPEELELICMKMLSKNPAERFASCREVHDRLEAFLEGSREKARRHEAAQTAVQEGDHLAQLYHESLTSVEESEQVWKAAAELLSPWDPISEKRNVWRKKKAYHQMQQELIAWFGAAINKYEQALEYERGNKDARQGLASLYWSRFLAAEAQNDTLQKLYYQDLVIAFDEGRYTELLKGTGRLRIRTQPDDAQLLIYRCEQVDGRLVESFLQQGGQAPVELSLPMGSYVLKLRKEGFEDLLVPVCLARCEASELHLRLYQESELEEDCVLIPGGRCTLGGDEEAIMALPAQVTELDDFLISRYPVTFAEYLAFVNDIAQRNPKEAKPFVPRSERGELYVQLDQNGMYAPNHDLLLPDAVRHNYPNPQEAAWQIPVLGVSWYDAVCYCRWRSTQAGYLVTLPTEQQWEKAASGVDRRSFPWGDEFDAAFCKMALSRPPEERFPEPVGRFSWDRSPYGVCDMVGTVSEWTRTFSLEELEQATGHPSKAPILRGGGWSALHEASVRIGSRIAQAHGARSNNTGFRIVIPLASSSSQHPLLEEDDAISIVQVRRPAEKTASEYFLRPNSLRRTKQDDTAQKETNELGAVESQEEAEEPPFDADDVSPEDTDYESPAINPDETERDGPQGAKRASATSIDKDALRTVFDTKAVSEEDLEESALRDALPDTRMTDAFAPPTPSTQAAGCLCDAYAATETSYTQHLFATYHAEAPPDFDALRQGARRRLSLHLNSPQCAQMQMPRRQELSSLFSRLITLLQEEDEP